MTFDFGLSYMWIMALERVGIEFIWHIVHYPLWWYGYGLLWWVRVCGSLVLGANEQLVPGLWLRNIFVPMFGQNDWQGRIMSVFMRLVNVIIRGLLLLVWTLCVFLLFLVWVVLPLLLIVLLVRSL